MRTLKTQNAILIIFLASGSHPLMVKSKPGTSSKRISTAGGL
jgi:hypothetical protein